MIRLLLLAALLVVGCGPKPLADNAEDETEWSYVTGPNGEHCLVMVYGNGRLYGIAGMECDSVNWPETGATQ